MALDKGIFQINRERINKIPVEDGAARYLGYELHNRVVFSEDGVDMDHGFTVELGSYVWDLEGIANFLNGMRPLREQKKKPFTKEGARKVLIRLQDKYHLIEYTTIKSKKTGKQLTKVTLPFYEIDRTLNQEKRMKMTGELTGELTEELTDTTPGNASNDKGSTVSESALVDERVDGVVEQKNERINNKRINNEKTTPYNPPWKDHVGYLSFKKNVEAHGVVVGSDQKVFNSFLQAEQEKNFNLDVLKKAFDLYAIDREREGREPNPSHFLTGTYRDYVKRVQKGGSERKKRTVTEQQKLINKTYMQEGGLLDEPIDLPSKAVQAQMEREARGEKIRSELVDPETEARLRAKVERMKQRTANGQKWQGTAKGE